MKILFVSGNLCDGGAQRVISVIASGLAERGHDVSLLLYARNEKEYPISEKVKITGMRDSFEEYSKLSGLVRVKFIRKYLKELKPEAAIGFMEGGYGLFLASLGMKFTKVASARIDPVVLLNAKGSRAMLDRLWFRSADAVIVQTTRQMEHAQGAKWKNMKVIANPVSDAALALGAHDYDRPCRRIVMAGRLEQQKNYPLVFAAMEQVIHVYPNAILDIYGKGSQEEALQQIIKEKGLYKNVNLRGWTQDVLGEYAASDLYVMSSNYEGMPNALMEAMAAGLPCVSTDCNTGPEDIIASGENGYLIPVKDVDALAGRTLEIMGMTPQQRRTLGEGAHRTMKEKFNKEVIVSQWEALLNALAERR